ncbi:MAG: glycoside hydrolase family 9 protein [Acidobacteriota bacterium]
MAWHLLLVTLLLAMPVGAQDGRRLETQLEQTKKWTVSRDGFVTIETRKKPGAGSDRHLRFRFRMDLGKVTDGLPSAPQVDLAWIPLPANLDLGKHDRLRFVSRVTGQRYGFFHVIIGEERHPWRGTRVFDSVPLDRSEGWQEAIISLDRISAAERRQLKWFGVMSINVGYMPDESEWMTIDIDDLQLDTVGPRQAGWEMPQGSLRVPVSGFRTHHDKIAIGDASLVNQRYLLLDEKKRPRFGGRFRRVESAVGVHAVADFSGFTLEGRYTLRAGQHETPPFPIGPDAWVAPIDAVADWILDMRCGVETALHPPCHLDDGWLVETDAKGKTKRRHLPLSGGWHDAGDIRTFYQHTYRFPHELLRIQEMGWTRDADRNGKPDALELVEHGLTHSLQARHPDTGALFQRTADHSDYRRGNYWTDNISRNSDDRLVSITPERHTDVAALAHSAGLYTRRYPGPLADQVLEVARERFDHWFHPTEGQQPWRKVSSHVFRHGHLLSMRGLGALHLHLATGHVDYLRQARHHASHVSGYQKATFPAGAQHEWMGEIFSWHQPLMDRDRPEQFLAEMLLELPRDSNFATWRHVLRRSAEFWMKPVRENWAPYALPQLEVAARLLPEGSLAVPWTHDEKGQPQILIVPTAGIYQLADTAVAINRVAQALDDPELDRLARRQVQWALGLNPSGTTWITDFDAASPTQVYTFSQGRMRGAITGYGLGNDGIPISLRPAGPEPAVLAGVVLMRAMVAVSEPARYDLKLFRGDRPWTGPVRVVSHSTRRTVWYGRAGRSGELSLELDGGQWYELNAGGVSVPLAGISGRRQARVVQLDEVLTLEASAPERVTSKTPFQVQLTVGQRGSAPVETEVFMRAAGVGSRETSKKVTLRGRSETTVTWDFHVGRGNRPYVITFWIEGEPRTYLDLTGVIEEAPPATNQ